MLGRSEEDLMCLMPKGKTNGILTGETKHFPSWHGKKSYCWGITHCFSSLQSGKTNITFRWHENCYATPLWPLHKYSAGTASCLHRLLLTPLWESLKPSPAAGKQGAELKTWHRKYPFALSPVLWWKPCKVLEESQAIPKPLLLLSTCYAALKDSHTAPRMWVFSIYLKQLWLSHNAP